MALSFSLGVSQKKARLNGRGKRTGSRGSRNRHTKKNTSSLPLVLSIAGGLVLASGTLGYFVWQDMNTLKPDEYACYPQANQAQTVVFVDSSNPRMDRAQARDFTTFVSDHYSNGAVANERFRFYNTEVDQIGSIPNPVVETCVPASTNNELEALGAPQVNSAYLTTQKQRIYDQTILPAVTNITDPAPDNPQRFESPLLEQIQSLSRLAEFKNGTGRKTLVIASDMVQSTRELQFCQTQGHLPRFEKFKAGDHFQRIKPHSLNGINVKVLMLIRPNYGAHCSGEDELRNWWTAYFRHAGASNVEFIRLRLDVSSGQ